MAQAAESSQWTVNQSWKPPLPSIVPVTTGALISDISSSFRRCLDLYAQWRCRMSKENHYRKPAAAFTPTTPTLLQCHNDDANMNSSSRQKNRVHHTVQSLALSSCALSTSLSMGAQVKEAYNIGLAMLGPAYATGDAACCRALTFQKNLLCQQESALQDAAVVAPARRLDIQVILQASETARLASVEALASQYRRMVTSRRDLPHELPMPKWLAPSRHCYRQLTGDLAEDNSGGTGGYGRMYSRDDGKQERASMIRQSPEDMDNETTITAMTMTTATTHDDDDATTIDNNGNHINLSSSRSNNQNETGINDNTLSMRNQLLTLLPSYPLSPWLERNRRLPNARHSFDPMAMTMDWLQIASLAPTMATTDAAEGIAAAVTTSVDDSAETRKSSSLNLDLSAMSFSRKHLHSSKIPQELESKSLKKLALAQSQRSRQTMQMYDSQGSQMSRRRNATAACEAGVAGALNKPSSFHPQNSVFYIFCSEAMALQVDVLKPIPVPHRCHCGFQWKPKISSSKSAKHSEASPINTTMNASVGTEKDYPPAIPLKEGFRMTPRFLAKSHCQGPVAGFGCVLCTSSGRRQTFPTAVTLQKHINMEHSKWQMLHDRDLR